MPVGTVKWFNATKGFGFITPPSGGKDVFVHITAVQKAGLQGLQENQKIEYEVAVERGKEAAINLKPVYGLIAAVFLLGLRHNLRRLPGFVTIAPHRAECGV